MDPEIHFIAVTNSLHTALELHQLPNAQVVWLGGPVNQKFGATFGVQAIQQLREFNLDKLFLSVDGIDAKMGVTNSTPIESEINHVVLECARQTIVVADHTKVGNVSFVQMGGIHEVDMLITDSGADAEAVEQLRQAGVTVQIV